MRIRNLSLALPSFYRGGRFRLTKSGKNFSRQKLLAPRSLAADTAASSSRPAGCFASPYVQERKI
jgi:hypothetical protein